MQRSGSVNEIEKLCKLDKTTINGKNWKKPSENVKTDNILPVKTVTNV
jgi:ribosomal 50S subunit-recycling heat shock protein